jgi:hypothetical protein
MDLSWNGPDATSQSSPIEFWVNSGHIEPGGGGNLDKDLPVPPNLPNCSYGQIRCPRNLENFARLWVCGTPSLSYFSNGYQVNLTWQNVSSGSPSIRLYRACETNGGIGYLTDPAIAGIQATNAAYGTMLYGGLVTNGSTFWFPLDEFTNAGNHYYLFEAAGVGCGELVLTISQNGNTIAQASAWLDLRDIKDLYERAVITNNTTGSISNWTSGIELVQPAVASSLGDDTNLIVFIHGFNVGNWDWITDSETVFKRLYWAGYHGKFASVKWPCGKVSLNPYGFNTSEVNAYKASTSLASYLNSLHSRFPNCRLNIFAHSQGNAVASEAIKQGAPFDTYILTQGAIPASCLDANAPIDTDIASHDTGSNITPEWQPMGYHGVYTNFTGRVVNYYNTNDFALATGNLLGGLFPVNWKANQQLYKPSYYYSYDGTNCWYVDFFFIQHLITDPEESRGNISRSRTDAVGATAGLSGAIQSSVDLLTQFGFGNALAEHSAQWTRPIQTVLPYYQQVLLQIQPAP